jgi:signal transduction histidine kinase
MDSGSRGVRGWLRGRASQGWWPSASLRAYLVAIILIATVPIGLLMGYQIYTDVTGQHERLQHDLERTAAATAQNVERELVSSIDALAILVQAAHIGYRDVEDVENALREHPWMRASWRSMFLVAGDGTVLFETDSAAAASAGVAHASVSDDPAFRLMLAQPGPMVSNLVMTQAGPPYRTAIAVPVVADGRLRYVLGVWVDAAAWQELLQKSGPPERGFLSLFDREHRVIARTQPAGQVADPQVVGRQLPAQEVNLMDSRPSGVHSTALLGGEPVYGAWRKVLSADWRVGVGIPAGPLDAAHRNAIVAALVTALLCLMLGLWLAFMVARHLTQPLHQLSASGLSLPAGHIAVREVAMLRDALFAARAQDEAARRRLQDTADEFETLFNSSPIGLAFARDPLCRVVTHNAAMDGLFGPAPDTDAGSPGDVLVLHHGQPLAREQQPLQRAAASGEAVAAQELEVVRDGHPSRHVLAHAVPLLDDHGQPRGAIGAAVDITERKLGEARLARVDERLRESQHLVDLAQEAGHVGFFHYHFDRDVLSWTQGQATLFGIAPHPFESKLDEWVRRIDHDDRLHVERGLRHLFATGQERETFEYRVSLPQGGSRWLSSRVLLIYGPDRRPQQMVGVSVDMTDEKEAQHERAALIEREKTARVEAEAANRAKDEFLAMLGHELRNPLSAIASAVEVLNRVGANSELAASARKIAARQTRHLAHMMDDLLDVGRVISGKVLLSRRVVDLAQLVQRVVSTLQVTGESAHHELRLNLHEAWIDADATRIEQVLTNLVTNALKYTPAGGRVGITVRTVDGGLVVLEVNDNGAGIPSDLLPRVFDLFVQGERTPDRRAGGLGIGLTLVRRLVELHGGTVQASSSPAGSVFTVQLPAADAPAPARTHGQVPPSRRRRVLVIEDNEDALAGLRAMLELDGHTVAAATDGMQGLRLLLEMRPDVAIVDIGLPGLTGLEVARRSRAAGFANRMIALSGYGQSSDIQQALVAGFDAHLVKPVNSGELRGLLMEA